ncbi:flavin reductase family protein [Streptomyces pseudovenezuelae]|uniref:Flavin reductase (DIM6/NTAB) family NADH-FMN oxidoreductase RutF n=1 Tax=Streptomyces pseudovenezuelae TaxID=67350 RepID=A0ABT6LEH5_9ACTN|nr:flavin reductase family protein [Streptomyces pseudovenezuelae]MDH6214711.1 flavin reductase (DIM6/NTAB) family NADH-FMN oxidoreductase RutF [Streptomyces pseudovenezuelae]
MTDLDPFTDLLDGPMYVVTAEAAGERAGCLVGFGSQCSIRPARFMVWLSKANRTFRVAEHAERLTVHLLRRDQHGLARLFGGETGDRIDKFTGIPWHPGPGGSPVLDEAPAWFVGRVENRIDGGDHVGFLLAPEAVENLAGDDGTAPLSLTDALDLDITPGHPVN